ncbi:phosphotransferase family protein [Allobranchiibius sp. CTAmp26]|uniref:phosphotransferase family protein n=1 Tax=Allobranchiibius sp. CTAmp26 TaxID=2815214 RepID=UPI001AA11F66|nr:phosphotransferase family protein [Allobranchiibius sp. CTAmp26]MBO1754437.1 phosphotransferase family protein [Allobranchiibius sp. CTAmp26]
MTDSPQGLDLQALSGFLQREAPGLLHGELTGRILAGGKSNLTYEVGDGTTSVVVRRPPLGHVLSTAHDMVREHTVITALAPTDVPVPTTYAVCPDDSVIGAPFYVMELVAGTPYRHAAQIAPLGPDRTRDIAHRLVDTLVALHAVDPESVGLGEFGRPHGFLERQVRRWRRQMDASASRDLPRAEELSDALAAAVPGDGDVSVLHGDYRLDNLLVGESDQVTAVLDWEMATLGDPLSDVALFVVYQQLSQVTPGAGVSDVAAAPGYPDTDTMLARYTAASGRDVSHIGWHMGLAYYKLATILEGIHYRYTQGQTVGSGFDNVGTAVGPLLDAGLAALREG